LVWGVVLFVVTPVLVAQCFVVRGFTLEVFDLSTNVWG